MCKNILQVSFYCFFIACSQTDAHFDPDTADNAKQWNRTHHETIPLVFVCIHAQWPLLIQRLLQVFWRREDFEDEEFYFLQDGAPPHHHSDVRSFLDGVLPNKWIGRRGFVEYPPTTRFFLMGIPERQSLRYKICNSRCFYIFEIIKF